MKAIKYLSIALVLVAVLATISWVLRNSIIERISGPALEKYGVAVTDVSLDALATETAEISYLELEHENGTVITIDGLSLPIGSSTTGIKSYTAESVTIDVPMERDAAPLALAQLIDQLLSLPNTLPNTEVIVAELNVAPYPDLSDLRWSSTEQQQELTANLDVIHLSAQITGTDEDNFKANFSLQHTSLKTPEQSITTDIRRSDSGVSISGVSMLELPITATIATSIAASLGTSLAGIEFANGTAIFEIDAELPFEQSQPASATAYLTPATPFELAYSVDSGVVNVVSVRSASPIKLEATYPQSQWSITEEQASLSMSYEDRNDITATIGNLNCANGPSCSMNLDVSMDNADLTIATARQLEFSAVQDVVFADDGIQVLIRQDAKLALTGMSVSGTEIASLNAALMSAATLELMEAGWEFTTESIDATVESLALTDEITFSAPVRLDGLLVSDIDQSVSLSSNIDSTSSQLLWDERTIAFPGFSGKVSLKDGALLSELTTAGLFNDGNILAEHDLLSGAGRMAVTDASLSFAVQNLSGLIAPWANDWDVTAGTVSTDLQLNWQQAASGWQLDGHASLTMSDLAGAYSDTAFAGLSTGVDASYETTTGLTTEPSHLDIDLLEVGLSIEDISADYTLNPGALSVDVEDLHMNAFGGVVTADPFTYEFDSERNSLLLRAESIELTELLTLKEFESIELSGRIGAELPVIIEGNEVSILDGKLTGEAPGGVIRYQPDIVPDTTGSSAIGIVTEALSNFEYDTLTSTVGYSKDGDLVLQMRIAGRNPDMEDNRPVVLNLGVENNIPKMLKSLQAARAVEEILEKRIRR